jgi:hypothetical protein
MDVTLYGVDRRPVQGTTRNLSARGMFVEAEDPSVFRSRFVRIRLGVGKPDMAIRGYVTRQSSSGAGVMLVDAELEPTWLAQRCLAPFYRATPGRPPRARGHRGGGGVS